MEWYKNLGGNSNVIAYEIGDSWIAVRFSDGSVYVYTYESAGLNNIEHMKNLARVGVGLNSFINLNVKYNYAKKRR
jgi:hypothetical protein